MTNLSSGSTDGQREALDLTSEAPVSGYDLSDLERIVHPAEVQANLADPHTGLRLSLRILTFGRLDHAFDYAMVCGIAVVSGIADVVICNLAGATTGTSLWSAAVVGGLVVVIGLSWISLRKK